MYRTIFTSAACRRAGSPELALDDPEARSTLPGAACSMSQEPYQKRFRPIILAIVTSPLLQL